MGGLYISEKAQARAQAAIGAARGDPVAFARAFFGLEAGKRQAEWARMRGRVQVAVAGRRFGKTTWSLVKMVHACLTRPNQRWVVAGPSIDQAQLYFKELDRFIQGSPLLQRLVVPDSFKWHPYPIVRWKSGSVMEARSTTLEGRYLRGMGLDGVVMTEAAFIPDVVWTEVVRATLLDRMGTAIIETTPNGAGNWTYRLFSEAREDRSGYYSAFHATCYDNERLDRLEIERIKREIPDLAFRQEYLAEFVDDQSAVFPWSVLEGVFDEDYAPAGKPEKEHRYVVGVDLAKHRDWTVICVLDVTKEPWRIAEWHRLQGVRYVDVAGMVNEISARYAARVYLDATGVGEGVSEHVLNAEKIVFTPKVRDDIVSDLLVTVEQRRVKLPPCLEVLRDEMRWFRRVEHGSRVKAEAPRNQHDDAVFALGLAIYGARSGGYAGLLEYYRRLREKSQGKVIPLVRVST